MRRSFLLTIGILAVPVLLLIAGLTGWRWQLDARRQATVDSIEATFPALGQAHVRAVERNGRCYGIEVGRATFHVFADGTPCGRSLDASSAPDLPGGIAELVDQLQHGPEMTSLRVTDRAAESVRGAEVEVGWCNTYIYEPGWTQLPPEDSFYVVPIDADWYVLACEAPWLA